MGGVQPVEHMSSGLPRTPKQQDDGGVFFVALKYKSTSYDVPVQQGDSVSSIYDFIQEVLDFPRENCKLICRGKVLRPDDAVEMSGLALAPGAKVMLVASSSHDISFVQNSRADPLVKGFKEEERDEQRRRKRAKAAQLSAWGTKQDLEYCFASIKAEFKYNTPTPFEAEALLKKLATDPGIIDIMTSRKFRVGILTEMNPVDAQERMAKRGTPNMDLLGYNQNQGEMIVLRLRTDSLKGFRPYHDLINTLIHELTHNVWGPHDQNFWRLYGELKAQYMKFHRFWSHGGQAVSDGSGGRFHGFDMDDNNNESGGASSGFGRVLGSSESLPTTEADRRSRATAAAEARALSKAPSFDFVGSGGAWVTICPCGQIHADGACLDGVQPVALSESPTELQEDSGDSTSADNNQLPPTSSPEVRAPEKLEAPRIAGIEVASTSDQTSESEKALVPAEQEVACRPTCSEPQPSLKETTRAGSLAVGGVQHSPGLHATENELALGAADLEALGLDGAVVWIDRFSGQLRTFCQHQRPVARSALALLLRLVSNVVERPSEAKFRRIRASNPRISAELLGAGTEAEVLIKMLGFECTMEAGERIFVLQDAAMDQARLRLGKELLESELGSMTATVH